MIPSLGGGPPMVPTSLLRPTRSNSMEPSPGSLQSHVESKCKFFSWLMLHGKILTADMLAIRGEPHDPRALETTIHLCQDCPFAIFVWFHVQAWIGEAPGATPTLPPPMGMTGGTCSPPLCPKTTEEGLATASSTPSGTSGRSATDVSSMKLASLISRSLLSPLMTPSRGPCLLVGHRWQPVLVDSS